jgi:hypothetical protein
MTRAVKNPEHPVRKTDEGRFIQAVSGDSGNRETSIRDI